MITSFSSAFYIQNGTQFIIQSVAKKGGFRYLYAGSNIMEVISILMEGYSRVPIISKTTGKIVKIISQSDIIN